MAQRVFSSRRRDLGKAYEHDLLTAREEEDLLRKVLDDRESWEERWKNEKFVRDALASGKEVDWKEFWRQEQVAACAEKRRPDRGKLWRNTAEVNRLIEANLRLMGTITRKYRVIFAPTCHEEEDVFNEVVVGFCKGVYRFDRALLGKIRLSTYIIHYFRHAIQSAAAKTGHVIRVPTHRIEQAAILRKATERFFLMYGSCPDDEQVIEMAALMTRERRARKKSGKRGTTKVTVMKVNDLRVCAEASALSLRSLDRSLNDEDGNSYHDITAAAGVTDAEEDVAKEEYRLLLVKALGTLSGIEKRVIESWFGMDTGRCAPRDVEKQTFMEIGGKCKRSTEGIRQIKMQALKKLRKQMGDMLGIFIPPPPPKDMERL